MWPFTRRAQPPDPIPPPERAVLFCARKWTFFLDQHKFPDDLPLSGQVALFTARMRDTLPGEVPALDPIPEADLARYVARGILQSRLTSRAELEQALGHPLTPDLQASP